MEGEGRRRGGKGEKEGEAQGRFNGGVFLPGRCN